MASQRTAATARSRAAPVSSFPEATASTKVSSMASYSFEHSAMQALLPATCGRPPSGHRATGSTVSVTFRRRRRLAHTRRLRHQETREAACRRQTAALITLPMFAVVAMVTVAATCLASPSTCTGDTSLAVTVDGAYRPTTGAIASSYLEAIGRAIEHRSLPFPSFAAQTRTAPRG